VPDILEDDLVAATGGRFLTVLKNLVVFGTVHAGRRHYYGAANVLARADRSSLEQLLTRRVGPDELDVARGPDHIKVAMEFQSP
jgi:glucose 1-dehydrogenase